MPAGVQVYTSDTNVVQIDGNYSNLQMTAKGTVYSAFQAVQANTNPNGTYYYDIPVAYVSFNAVSPVFAVSGDTSAAVVATSNSGNSWTVTIWTPNGPAGVDWFVFDRATPADSKSGLQVFNDAQQLVFDAQMKYLKVVGNVLDLVPVHSNGAVNGLTSPFTYGYGFPGKRIAIGAMLTPINWGTTKWPSGENTVPGSPNCRGLGLGCWRGVAGAAYFDFVHTIVSYRGYYDGGAVNQVFANSAAVDDQSYPFGVRQFGALLLDVTNY